MKIDHPDVTPKVAAGMWNYADRMTETHQFLEYPGASEDSKIMYGRYGTIIFTVRSDEPDTENYGKLHMEYYLYQGDEDDAIFTAWADSEEWEAA